MSSSCFSELQRNSAFLSSLRSTNLSDTVTRDIQSSKYSVLSSEDIRFAGYLLEEKLFLSALEYYFEQLERGKCIPVLHEFFSDAKFLEKVNPVSTIDDSTSSSNGVLITRCQSVSTLDSIDFAARSSDGFNILEEKIKVLEYELRKKNETIETLRNELTQLTVGSAANSGSCNNNSETMNSVERQTSPDNQTSNILPYEARALGVLIHEYMLQQNYRVASVQFTEECESAGLYGVESWDQVGINLKRPPNLLQLLRAHWSPDEILSPVISSSPNVDVALQVDKDLSKEHVSEMQLKFSPDLIESQAKVTELRFKVAALEGKNAHLQSQAQHWRNQLICMERENAVRKAGTNSTQILPSPPSSDIVDQRLESSSWEAVSSTIPAYQTTVTTDLEESTSVHESQVDSMDRNNYAMNEEIPAFGELSDNQALHLRSPSVEFTRHMTNLLPRHATQLLEGNPLQFQLSNCLDEFVALVADQLEVAVPHMSDAAKKLTLPLLTQVICLHPEASVRDRILRLLFNLFTTRANPDAHGGPRIGGTFLPPSTTLSVNTFNGDVADSFNSAAATTDGHQYRLLVLAACKRLASYLSPTRLESELLPQLWSQLNERPIPDPAQRLLIVSACGIIAPNVPAHLQSSLMLSILESNLLEDRDELIRAANIRSLACVVNFMSDADKMPQIIERLRDLLLKGKPFIQHRMVETFDAPPTTASSSANAATVTSSDGAGADHSPEKPSYVTTVDWLLPSVAQWCLELDSLHTMLIDPWLDHLDTYILATGSSSSPRNPGLQEMVIQCFALLAYLVPFLHAWLMITLVNPDQRSGSYWMAATSLSPGDSMEEECTDYSNIEQISALTKADDEMVEDDQPESNSIINVRLILGSSVYQNLQPMFEQALESISPSPTVPTLSLSSPSSSPSSPESTPAETSAQKHENHVTSTSCTVPRKWPARSWLVCLLQPKLNDLLSQIPHKTVNTPMVASSINASIYDHQARLEEFVSHQYDDHFACPWNEPPGQSYQLSLCLATCQFMVDLAQSLGSVATEKLLTMELQTQLMNVTERGTFEYNHRLLQTGMLAAYCCLLSANKNKTELNRVRMLMTNIVFLHVRESLVLDSIRLAIWCLCLTCDLGTVVLDVVLPALHRCVICADSMVRRVSATLLHSLIEALHFVRLTGQEDVVLEGNTSPFWHGDRASLDTADLDSVGTLADRLFRFVARLTRDDVTGQRKRVVSDEADWAVLSVSLGPLYGLLRLCKTRSPDGRSINRAERLGCIGDNSLQFESKLIGLIGEVYDLVVGGENSNDSSIPSSENAQLQLTLVHHRFWYTLSRTLLNLSDRLLPSCPDSFRDTILVPWLYQLSEMSNTLPNMDQRIQLAERLFAVFSTAAYSIQRGESMCRWLLPGLNRVRLCLLETAQTRQAQEVDRFFRELYLKLDHSDDPEFQSSKPKEAMVGLRNVVSSQFARLTMRGSQQNTVGIGSSEKRSNANDTATKVQRQRSATNRAHLSAKKAK